MSILPYEKYCTALGCEKTFPLKHKGATCGEDCCKTSHNADPGKIAVRQTTPADGNFLICRSCEHKHKDPWGPVRYSADHGERCDNGHLLVPHDFKLTPTEVVEAQLLKTLEGLPMSAADHVPGYSHAFRLMQWAEDEGLVSFDRDYNKVYEDQQEFWKHGASVTARGLQWLEQFGGSEKANLAAMVKIEQELTNDPKTLRTIKAIHEMASQFEIDHLTNE